MRLTSTLFISLLFAGHFAAGQSSSSSDSIVSSSTADNTVSSSTDNSISSSTTTNSDSSSTISTVSSTGGATTTSTTTTTTTSTATSNTNCISGQVCGLEFAGNNPPSAVTSDGIALEWQAYQSASSYSMVVKDTTNPLQPIAVQNSPFTLSTTNFQFGAQQGFQTDRRYQFSLTAPGAGATTPAVLEGYYHVITPQNLQFYSTSNGLQAGSNVILGLLSNVDKSGFTTTSLEARPPGINPGDPGIFGNALKNDLVIVAGLTPGTNYAMRANAQTLGSALSPVSGPSISTQTRLGDLTESTSNDYSSSSAQGITLIGVPRSTTATLLFGYIPAISANAAASAGTVLSYTRSSTGSLTAVNSAQSSGYTTNAEYTTANPSLWITSSYVVTVDAGVDTFSYDSSGTLTHVSHAKNSQYAGFVPYVSALSPDGTAVYTAGFNQNSGPSATYASIMKNSIDSSGNLGAMTEVYHDPNSGSTTPTPLLKGWYTGVQLTNGSATAIAYPQRMLFSHDGSVAITIADAIYAFIPNATSNQIVKTSMVPQCVDFIAAGNRADIAFSPDDDYFYLFCGGGFHTYSRSKTQNTFDLVRSLFTGTNDWDPVKFNIRASDMLSGSIYTSTYVKGTVGQTQPYQGIATYTRDSTTGALVLRQLFTSPSQAKYATPSDITVTPDGKFVYVAQPGPNGGAGKISVFTRTGLLQDTTTSGDLLPSNTAVGTVASSSTGVAAPGSSGANSSGGGNTQTTSTTAMSTNTQTESSTGSPLPTKSTATTSGISVAVLLSVVAMCVAVSF